MEISEYINCYLGSGMDSVKVQHLNLDTLLLRKNKFPFKIMKEMPFNKSVYYSYIIYSGINISSFTSLIYLYINFFSRK